MSANTDSGVRSVHRAVSILQVLARTGPVGVSRIAEEVGIHKSTAFRLLATLEARGLVDQNASRGEYRLGDGVVGLAAGVTQRHDISVISRAVCTELAQEVGETVNITVREGFELVTLDQVVGASAITTVNWTGQRQQLHATAGGKVFLAAMNDDELDEYLTTPLPRYTEFTLTDPAALRADIERVRELGYSYTGEELEIGLAAIGAPIRSLRGDVEAALAISGPSFRVNRETLPGLIEELLAAASSISARNGYPLPG
ncbi:IclR family transcriptional regulator [Gordonia sp. FQ]|uniref:IclR family transcriptional regulator n=1 Tax=Gordonia sp. FQ TaxID=3446634 RepID=UPI003F851475